MSARVAGSGAATTTLRVGLDELKASGRVHLHDADRGVLVVWTGDSVCAVADACPHRGLPLGEGVIRDGVITCPAHLQQYDVRTGARHDDPRAEPLATYATRIVQTPDGDVVEVELPEPEAPPTLRQLLLEHARSSGPRSITETVAADDEQASTSPPIPFATGSVDAGSLRRGHRTGSEPATG